MNDRNQLPQQQPGNQYIQPGNVPYPQHPPFPPSPHQQPPQFQGIGQSSQWGQPPIMPMQQQRHQTPRCTQCGTITQWQVEPILLVRHYIIGGILLLFFGSGLLYLLIVLIIRSNSNSRAKICPSCGAHNLWTFIY